MRTRERKIELGRNSIGAEAYYSVRRASAGFSDSLDDANWHRQDAMEKATDQEALTQYKADRRRNIRNVAIGTLAVAGLVVGLKELHDYDYGQYYQEQHQTVQESQPQPTSSPTTQQILETPTATVSLPPTK